MSGMSRRALLQASAGAAALAAVPMSALSSGVATAGAARAATAGDPDADRASGPALHAAHGEPVMFCVHDAARGEVSILHGADEVVVRDRQLVARIMQAASRQFGLRGPPCHRIVKPPRSPRIPSPTTPTPTPSSAPTGPTPSRSSPTTSRSRIPPAGPNFFEFGDDVLYRINVDNDGDGRADVTYEFRFKTTVANPETRSSTTPGRSTSLDSPNFNRPQTYSVTEVRKSAPPQRSARTSRRRRATSACGRRRTTPPRQRRDLRSLGDGIEVFAGQRLDGFYVDLGSVFDLAALRPFQNLHLIPTPAARRHQRLAGVQRAHDRHPGPDQPAHPQRASVPTDPMATERGDRRVGVGVPRRRRRFRDEDRRLRQSGPFTQVSRLGNPLFNEVIVPMGRKDRWNALPPHRDYGVRPVRRPARARPSCCRCCTPACSRTWPRYDKPTAPTCWRSC